jgi:tRNA threonylcarbamoyladenosine biosynthesis protein TsaE
MVLTTRNVDETLSLGRLLGALAPSPPATLCIALDGQLGAGKTQLTRGIAAGAAVRDPSLVSSPTYVLLNIYDGPTPVYHLDAYRLGADDTAQEFSGGAGDLGLEELLTSGGIVVIEWAARIQQLLPPDHLHILMEHHADDAPGGSGDADNAPADPGVDLSRRKITLQGTGPQSAELLEQLAARWSQLHGGR